KHQTSNIKHHTANPRFTLPRPQPLPPLSRQPTSRAAIGATMAQATLSQEDLKALEQARQRLYQLSNNIASLKGDVLRSSPLPQWSVGTCGLTHLPCVSPMLMR